MKYQAFCTAIFPWGHEPQKVFFFGRFLREDRNQAVEDVIALIAISTTEHDSKKVLYSTGIIPTECDLGRKKPVVESRSRDSAKGMRIKNLQS